jgi:hypothetical protein
MSLLTRMQIDVFQLPHEARVHTIPSDRSINTGETTRETNNSNRSHSAPLGRMHGTLAIRTIVRVSPVRHFRAVKSGLIIGSVLQEWSWRLRCFIKRCNSPSSQATKADTPSSFNIAVGLGPRALGGAYISFSRILNPVGGPVQIPFPPSPLLELASAKLTPRICTNSSVA